MLPIGDSPNPRGIAWVTMILIALNVGVYLLLFQQMDQPADPKDPRYVEYVRVLQSEGRLPGAPPPAEAPDRTPLPRVQISEYDLTVFEHGSRPANWTWLSMLTSMFLHGGFMHLAGNMLFLWIYGNNVEHRLGRFWYVIAYLATGFAASWGDIFLRPDSNIPGVGASGAISGVLGLYFIWFPKNQVRLLIMMPPVVRQMEVGARWVLGFYIVAQNILPAVLSSGQGGGIAYGAHIGGFIAGVIVAFYSNWHVRQWPGRKKMPEEQRQPGELAAARGSPGGVLGRFRQDLEAGDVASAARLFFEAPRELAREGVEARDAVRLGEALAAAGEPAGALAAYEQASAMPAQGEVAAAAHLGAAGVLAGPLHQPTVAYQHLVAAMQAGATEAQAAEAREILREIRPQVGSIPRRYA